MSASVAGKRGFGREVPGVDGPGFHATRQPAAENRGKLPTRPTEYKWLFWKSSGLFLGYFSKNGCVGNRAERRECRLLLELRDVLW